MIINKHITILLTILAISSGCSCIKKSNRTIETLDFLGEYMLDSTTSPCFSFYDSLLNTTIHGYPVSFTKRIYLSKNHSLHYYNQTQNDSPTRYIDKNGNEVLFTRHGNWKIKNYTLILNFESDKKIEHYFIKKDSIISINKSEKTIWVKDPGAERNLELNLN